jgi:pimeloyl-ACP methyl ester carboxylesterase
VTEIELTEHHGKVAGLETVWLRGIPAAQGPAPPSIFYLHGNPVGSWIWRPFLERTGGIAPDLPGFGRSAKPRSFDYSLPGYAECLERFVDQMGLDRISLVLHDIGAIVGLVFAQRVRERLERLVVANHAPLLPGSTSAPVLRPWRQPRRWAVPP